MENKTALEERIEKFESLTTVRTFRGHEVDLLTGPTLEQVDILDIAHHLALQNRYAGASAHPFSTAEHSVYVAMLAPKMYRPYFLLHDSGEYVLQDFTKSLKNIIKKYTTIYDDLTVIHEKAIFSAFGLSYEKFKVLYLDIKAVDLQVYDFERRFINPQGNKLKEGHALYGMPFGMTWQQAESAFLEMFEDCMA